LVKYGERAAPRIPVSASPTKKSDEKTLKREMKFVLRWKICAILMFALWR